MKSIIFLKTIRPETKEYYQYLQIYHKNHQQNAFKRFQNHAMNENWMNDALLSQ